MTDDNSLPEESTFAEFQIRVEEASRIFGKKINVAAEHKGGLVQAGFEGVVEVIRKVSSCHDYGSNLLSWWATAKDANGLLPYQKRTHEW